MRSNICAIIPARGGSTRIKNKNLLVIAGKTLIERTIENALRMTDNVIVTTDSEEIKKISEQYNVRVINRPKKLANNRIHSIEAVKHAMRYTTAEWVVMLNCTAYVEFEFIGHILNKPRECFAVIPFMGFVYDKFGKCLNWTNRVRPRSQDQDQYKEHGGFYMFKNDANVQHQVVPGAQMIIVDATYEIDEPEDVEHAVQYHSRNRYQS